MPIAQVEITAKMTKKQTSHNIMHNWGMADLSDRCIVGDKPLEVSAMLHFS